MLKSLSRIFYKTKQKSETEHNLMAQIDSKRLPNHIAIIMDGNGRWATRKGLPRGVGHRAGVETLRKMVKLCSNLGVNYLTLYAFSTENWKRPQEEVNILMDLLVEYLNKELLELHKNKVRINALGEVQFLPKPAVEALKAAIETTKNNEGLHLNLCLNYGGRLEITTAVKKIVQEVQLGTLKIEDIDQAVLSERMYTGGMPDPDLLIRPAGEQRISNFLLWQLAYAEFWLTEVFWPDFREEHLLQAILEFQNRERRFGGL